MECERNNIRFFCMQRVLNMIHLTMFEKLNQIRRALCFGRGSGGKNSSFRVSALNGLGMRRNLLEGCLVNAAVISRIWESSVSLNNIDYIRAFRFNSKIGSAASQERVPFKVDRCRRGG